MSSPESSPPELSFPGLDRLLSLVEADPPSVVLIDGPSGAGKSTLADSLAASWPRPVAPTLVRMDDIYPGWSGLRAASEHVGRYILTPRSHRETAAQARWRRHDWTGDAPAEWHPVDPRRPVIVEGCGTLSRSNAAMAGLCVWLTAEEGIRKRRALARDNGGFDAHWDQWQAEFEDFVAREHPTDHADVILDGTEELGSGR